MRGVRNNVTHSRPMEENGGQQRTAHGETTLGKRKTRVGLFSKRNRLHLKNTGEECKARG